MKPSPREVPETMASDPERALGIKVHDLKTWPQAFDATVSGCKPFELRKDDRGFEVGDVLHLHRFDPWAQAYTGAQAVAVVSHITHVVSWFPDADPSAVVLGLSSVIELEPNERTEPR